MDVNEYTVEKVSDTPNACSRVSFERRSAMVCAAIPLQIRTQTLMKFCRLSLYLTRHLIFIHFICMHYNAPPHTANIVQNVLVEQLNWPACNRKVSPG